MCAQYVRFFIGLLAILYAISSSARGELIIDIDEVTATVGDTSVVIPIYVSSTNPTSPDSFNSVTLAFGVGDGGPPTGSDPAIPITHISPLSVWDGATTINSITPQTSLFASVAVLTMNMPTPDNVAPNGLEGLMNVVLDISSITQPTVTPFPLVGDFLNLGNAAVFRSLPGGGQEPVPFQLVDGSLTIVPVPEPIGYLYCYLIPMVLVLGRGRQVSDYSPGI